MQTFKIHNEFLLDGEPIQLISGAVHYFRIPPSQWEDSLYNLKALGANTVETYIPWNIHEPVEGKFDFNGIKNIEKFVQIAKQLDLLVILRPSVYICAEWEFGGLPAWLLKNKNIRLRSTDPIFMEKVYQYYSILLPKLVPMQITHGGPVIMMQVENEYGSYGMEKEYLRQTRDLMLQFGIDVPLFTSDGAWEEVLDAGTLIDEDVFVAGNFGSHSIENSNVLKKFMTEHGKVWPIMCMEYWDGWFNRWGEPIVKRNAEDLAYEVKKMLEVGSLNLYMFHGGTNFGFYNGCSARRNADLPQVTSYDYDALLTEWGEPTEKFYAVQRVIKEHFPTVWQAKPRGKTMVNLGKYPIQDSVSLLAVKDIMMESIESTYPLTMEEAGTGYGYQLYTVQVKNYCRENKLRVIEANDRIQIFVDGKYLATQYQETVGEELLVDGDREQSMIEIDVLVENIGRVNYGFKFNHPSQSKGIRGGIIHDIHFHQGYKQYPLVLDQQQLAKIDFTKKSNPKQPSFYRTRFVLEKVGDTFIDCSTYGKGVILVNGHHLGRYWHEGPILYLYCPGEFLNIGENEVIIFETEGIKIEELNFSSQPIYKIKKSK